MKFLRNFEGDVEKLIWFLSYKHVQDSIDFNVRDPQGLTGNNREWLGN